MEAVKNFENVSLKYDFVCQVDYNLNEESMKEENVSQNNFSMKMPLKKGVMSS